MSCEIGLVYGVPAPIRNWDSKDADFVPESWLYFKMTDPIGNRAVDLPIPENVFRSDTDSG